MTSLRTFSIGSALLLLVALSVLGCGSKTGSEHAIPNNPPGPPAFSGAGEMVNVHGGTYIQIGNRFDAFDDEYAAATFSNTFNGLVECVNQTGSPCSIADAPPPPVPDPAETFKAAEAQACTFFNGGTLIPATYVQNVVISPVPYDNTYKWYLYHYDVIPLVSSVPPDNDSDDTVRVTGEISIELVMFPQANVPMYAFTTSGLVQDLRLEVNNAPADLQTNIVQNCPGCFPEDVGSLDFSFTPNVGTSGDAMSYVKSGDARKILNSDQFVANDNGGATGSFLQKTVFQTPVLALGPGEYPVVLTGTAANTSFSVSTTLRILEESCQVP